MQVSELGLCPPWHSYFGSGCRQHPLLPVARYRTQVVAVDPCSSENFLPHSPPHPFFSTLSHLVILRNGYLLVKKVNNKLSFVVWAITRKSGHEMNATWAGGWSLQRRGVGIWDEGHKTRFALLLFASEISWCKLKGRYRRCKAVHRRHDMCQPQQTNNKKCAFSFRT